jgi:type IV pilus assembly protein PilB
MTQSQFDLSPELIRHYRVIPLEKINDILKLGMINPSDQNAIDAVTFHTGLKIFPTLIAEDQFNQFIKLFFNEKDSDNNLKLSLLHHIKDDTANIVQENTVNYDEPLIQFVDNLIQHALQQDCSDIHIEPYDKICRIRYRRDGMLAVIAEIPTHLASRLVSRLKILAQLDISERRIPQDGRFIFQTIDIRINTCPTVFGEKVVLRLLNANKLALDIDTLGFNQTQKNLFIHKISQPHGMILVTGPTGSGKTVTLYSALHYLNKIEKNISTVENPVEIQLAGVNQVNINPKIGLDFLTVLRAFLRQDPDILMVGEIRDKETAEVTIQAANTGHLVLSTLHTNTAIEAISRLLSMGIVPYNIINSISLIISQRLVRKLCAHCKKPETITTDILTQLEFQKILPSTVIYHPIGCHLCLNGYRGRTGIYELLPLTEKITHLILTQRNIAVIKQQAESEGFYSLYQAGIEKILNGTTSINEVQRVIYQ